MTPLLIDTDPGIDDALALLCAFGAPECSIEAITTVAGNVELPLATRNARRVVAVAAPARPPVIVPGAARPLERALVTAVRYHGADGLGDAFPGEPSESAGRTHPGAGSTPDGSPGTGQPSPGEVASGGGEPAAPRTIVETARRLEGTLTVVALGPLTNLALAAGLDGSSLRRVGRFVVMGGAVDVRGNVTPAAEFNVHVDPEAARRVLGVGLPIDLVPLNVTQRVILRQPALETALSNAPRRLADFVTAFTRFAFRVDAGSGMRGMPLHDPLALGLAIDPSFATFESVRIEVGAGGETLRRPGPPNCRVAVTVQTERFLEWFLQCLCRASS